VSIVAERAEIVASASAVEAASDAASVDLRTAVVRADVVAGGHVDVVGALRGVGQKKQPDDDGAEHGEKTHAGGRELRVLAWRSERLQPRRPMQQFPRVLRQLTPK